MLVVLEGIDGSGKTTAAGLITDRLARLGYEVNTCAFGPPEEGVDLVDAYVSALDALAPSDDRPVALVIDRWNWGEAVYGPRYRPDQDVEGYGSYGVAGFRYLELLAASRGGVTAFLDTKPEVARARITARAEGEDFIDLDDLEDLAKRYDEVYRESTTGIRVFSSYPPPNIAQAAISNALSREEASKHLSEWPSYIGTIRPTVLVAMPADREQRLSLLGKLADNEWPHVGFVNSAMSSDSLVKLADALGDPAIRILTNAAAGPAHEHATGADVPMSRRTRFDNKADLLESVRLALHS